MDRNYKQKSISSDAHARNNWPVINCGCCGDLQIFSTAAWGLYNVGGMTLSWDFEPMGAQLSF